MSDDNDDFDEDPDTFAAIRLRMIALQERSEKFAKEAQHIAREVRNLSDALLSKSKPGSGSLKRDDGRLNEAGVEALNAAFANGMGVMEASKAFGISPSAASNRRKIWASLKGNRM